MSKKHRKIIKIDELIKYYQRSINKVSIFDTITEMKEFVSNFEKLLDELERCKEDEQMQKIEKMNEVMDEMNDEEFKSVFTMELLNEIDEMIEEKKLSLENLILLMKHVGYCYVLKNVWNLFFDRSPLGGRFEKMIFEEEKKKERKNKKLLIDLCECFVLLNNRINSELISICIPCLLKIALKKEENEETQKEVEIALLALSNISPYQV
ncbi:uncharacterized protein MONOS_1472 [Monocercomonoides exilis]|uniref:uncharacterized protein n=1 Tax=Monocercomonoides exilis TaxID=2049356 RepID=UPI003559BF5B|nr:hypothetical protein MONOS_1472 [Monocercomonoides exilis]|eukprot:MONOS_1472.1-p1 / transcript=MONOS_1472.1 / gene=MONOS_1472 / organism=Monocercomonoides_exilis_PA203 / gene_product=unspecified product / transcript_product=unspecified product / location=Mono_scaffold00026:79371-80413(+) / protein_length=209 / sequence_SO=supercontig / SO=protein_coding / is_pseudo=false